MKKSIIALVSCLIIIGSSTEPNIIDVYKGSTSFIKEELRCMELNIHHEARGESYAGKIAIANVTMNRVRSGIFPDSICKVIKQPNQFSWVSNDTMHTRVTDPDIKRIAFDTVISRNVEDNTHGAMFFHNKSVDDFRRKLVAVIGEHKFYK